MLGMAQDAAKSLAPPTRAHAKGAPAPQAFDHQRDPARHEYDARDADDQHAGRVTPKLQLQIEGLVPPVIQLADQFADVGPDQVDVALQPFDILPFGAHAKRSLAMRRSCRSN